MSGWTGQCPEMANTRIQVPGLKEKECPKKKVTLEALADVLGAGCCQHNLTVCTVA